MSQKSNVIYLFVSFLVILILDVEEEPGEGGDSVPNGETACPWDGDQKDHHFTRLIQNILHDVIKKFLFEK
jgi:hypothetical protein